MVWSGLFNIGGVAVRVKRWLPTYKHTRQVVYAAYHHNEEYRQIDRTRIAMASRRTGPKDSSPRSKNVVLDIGVNADNCFLQYMYINTT